MPPVSVTLTFVPAPSPSTFSIVVSSAPCTLPAPALAGALKASAPVARELAPDLKVSVNVPPVASITCRDCFVFCAVKAVLSTTTRAFTSWPASPPMKPTV